MNSEEMKHHVGKMYAAEALTAEEEALFNEKTAKLERDRDELLRGMDLEAEALLEPENQYPAWATDWEGKTDLPVTLSKELLLAASNRKRLAEAADLERAAAHRRRAPPDVGPRRQPGDIRHEG